MKQLTFLLIALFSWSLGYGQLRVVTNGDIGLGTTTPQSKLSIHEGITQLHIGKSTAGASNSLNVVDITPGSTGSLRIGSWDLVNNSAGGAAFQAWSSSTAFLGAFFFDGGNVAGSSINYRFGSTTRMRILQNGNVGIGTTAPAYKLTVNGDIGYSGALIVTSDKRLKENVTSFERGLADVMKLKPISFEYTGEGGTKSGNSHIGLYAQDLQKIAPEMVTTFVHNDLQEATLDEYYKSNGEKEYLAIKDSELKYMLINAIKEQQATIEELSSQVEKLTLMVNDQNVNNSSTFEGTTQNVVVDGVKLSSVGQNIPNPHNGVTKIPYTLENTATSAFVNLYNNSGMLIKKITLDTSKKSGLIDMSVINLASGSYIYNLEVDGIVVDTKKMILTR